MRYIALALVLAGCTGISQKDQVILKDVEKVLEDVVDEQDVNFKDKAKK